MAWTLTKRVWLLLIGVAVAIVGLLYIGSRRPPGSVTVMRVMRTDLDSSITSNGKVEPVTPYSLRAKYDGFVDRVLVMEGQSVKKGQLLVVLNSTDVQAQLDQARAQLGMEEDDLRAAKAGGRSDQAARLASDLRTTTAQRALLQQKQDALVKLAANNAATREEVDNNHADLERAEAQLDQAQKAKEEFERQAMTDRDRLALLVDRSRAQVADLQDKVNSAHVTSPVNGTLYSLPVHERDFVHVGDLLAEAADLSRVRVRAYIDEPELGKLQPNQEVEVTWDALPDRTWKGTTELIPRQVVARGSRSVGEVLCSVSNEKMELIPNTTVDVRIRLNQHTHVLVIPRGAVQIVGAHRYVYLVERNRIHRQEIGVGLTNDTQLEVLSGVQEDDALALLGGPPLQENARVRVANPQ
jgi:HlyD family secretion protein